MTAGPAQTSPSARDERGFILVAVLWILAALATLASVYSVYVGNAAWATNANDDRLRIRAAISSALELTAYKLTAAPKDARPPHGGFAFRLGHSAIEVTFVAEGSRIDLNAAPKEMLAGLFTAVGASPDDAATFADRIIGWRNKGVVADQDKEAALYQSASYAYAPRQAPFQNALELALVLGLPAAIVQRVLPFVTVFSGHAEIDVRVAEPVILFSLPNAQPDQINQIIAQREQIGADGEALLRSLGPARTGATAETSPAFRIRVRVALDDGRVARAEVVILVLEGEDDPYRVLSWRDDVDGSL